MAVGDLLMFVMSGLINAQVWQNVHFYRVIDTSGIMAEGEFVQVVQGWADWYQDTVHPVLSDMVADSMTWTGVKGQSLYNEGAVGEVFYFPALTGNGGGGQALAQFNAYGFTQASLRRGMNPGKRRIPGVIESLVGSFGVLDAPTVALAASVAAAFSEDIFIDYAGDLKGVEIAPVIVKRVREGEGTPESPYEYRLPRVPSEGVTYYARSWTADTHITTQNSRKTGRGI